LRLIDLCITQLQAQGPSRTCNESNEEEKLPIAFAVQRSGPEGCMWVFPALHPPPRLLQHHRRALPIAFEVQFNQDSQLKFTMP